VPVVSQAPLPMGRGGHSLFAVDDKLYSYGGWNSECQYNNVIIFDMNTCEWSDPDIYNDVSRWNHSAIMVEAIPSWKYFIFGGESTNFNEGQVRTFGQYVNTACYLDIASMRWSPVMPESENAPSPREYAAISYDYNSSRMIIFGGWSNGWLSDMWTLNVSKIVGPSYAVTHVDPPLGQLSGGVPITLRGVGFKDQNIKIHFTCGKTPTDVAGKNTLEVPANFISETEVTALSPNFEAFGPKEAVIQISVSGGDLTTTWVPFTYFMNTRAFKSLCFGPGVLKDQAIGEPVEFIIQARNDHGENRKSGRDVFQVTIRQGKNEIPCEITDKDNGQYFVKYQVDEECDVSIEVLFCDDKGKLVPVRGSPYTANFVTGTKPEMNHLNGPALPKHVNRCIEQTQAWMKEMSQSANTKDKNLDEIKVLISVVDSVKSVTDQNETMMLQLDQLEETLNLLQSQNMSKDSQHKQSKKLQEEWVNLKKLAKDMKKEISPLVTQETSKNNNAINKLEEDQKHYTQEMKKRDFYKYDCGKD
jgi:dynein heavy chain, axonemal